MIINFTVLDILPSLLDKTKTQTIRPAWKEYIIPKMETDHVRGHFKGSIPPAMHFNDDGTLPKPPRFKVGDKVKLLWKQRSKYKWFLYDFGQIINPTTLERSPLFKEPIYCETEEEAYHIYEDKVKYTDIRVFNKLLGTGVITEVFEIEMGYAKIDGKAYFRDKVGTWYVGVIDSIGKKLSPKLRKINEGINFYKKDGFSSAKQMFKWFDKRYNLAEGKKFYVYRWKWDK